MKINNRLYPYPVLCADKDDYKTCHFNVAVTHSHDVHSLTMDFVIDMNCSEIQQLINEGKAEYMIHLECYTTAFREAITGITPNITHKIPVRRINGIIERTALIVLSRDIKDFECADWNNIFDGNKFSLNKGSILAYQNLKPLKIDKDYEESKNVNSIFVIYKDVSNYNKPFNVDIERSSNNIYIGLGENEYKLYNIYSQKPDMQPILNSMIILPALVYIFEALRQKEINIDYTRQNWYKSLVKNYQELGSNLEEKLNDENTKSIELAQIAMELPLIKALSNISSIYESGDD